MLIDSEDDLRTAVDKLIAKDDRLAAVYDATGLPPLRRQPGGFRAVLYMITEQMISLQAAAAIWQRVEARFHPFDPAHMASADEADYRACGLSGPKLRSMQALAENVANGALNFDILPELDDTEVVVHLTRIRGIGDWTAQIYLLACLGRPDAWPAGDVALQTAMQHTLRLDERPKAKQMTELAEAWRPHRAVAARLLWAYYRTIR